MNTPWTLGDFVFIALVFAVIFVCVYLSQRSRDKSRE